MSLVPSAPRPAAATLADAGTPTAGILSRPDYAPSPADVALTSRILRKLLPAELILQILHAAEYYPRRSTRLSYQHSVSASSGRGARHVGIKAVLVTPPVPGQAKDVRTVRWWVRSRDQGWSGEPPENKGTFRCSWTWFEAAIYRPVDRATKDSKLENKWRRGSGAVNVTDPEEFVYPEPGFEEVSIGGRTRWLVQRNRNSCKDMGEYVIEWRHGYVNGAGSGGVEVSEHGGWGAGSGDVEEEMRVGSGGGGGFVEGLQKGDRVVLLARALYPGWVNMVSGASVEMEFGTVDL